MTAFPASSQSRSSGPRRPGLAAVALVLGVSFSNLVAVPIHGFNLRGELAGAASASELAHAAVPPFAAVQAADPEDVTAAKKALTESLKAYGTLTPPASAAASGPSAQPNPGLGPAPVPAEMKPVRTEAGATKAADDAVKPPVPAAETEAVSPLPSAELEAQQKTYFDMAAAMVKRGDIAGARVVLGRLARDGSGRATFELAQTFDPRMLDKWGVRGIRPDADKARSLYQTAAQLGIPEASERIAGLAPK